LQYPSELWKLTLICLILFSAAVTISVTQNILARRLYNELQGQVDTLAEQGEEYRCLMEAESAILQYLSVDEYFF